jgi:chain length determinant protein (polysaccharide antigen chain regulator)
MDLQLTFTNGVVVADPDPIKPQKAMILALSVVLGGMLGVVIALVRSAVRNRKPQTAV